MDFCTENFDEIWRRDLPQMKHLGVNFLRLYHWNPEGNSHNTFVAQCGRLGLRINLPIVLPASDDMSETSLRHVHKCVDDALKLTPVVTMYTILNDYNTSKECTIDHVKFVIEALLQYEKRRGLSPERMLPIAVPITLEERIHESSAMQDIFNLARQLGIVDRLINCVNIRKSAVDMRTFIKHNYKIGASYEKVPLLIGEYGCASGMSGLKEQASTLKEQWTTMAATLSQRRTRSPKSKKSMIRDFIRRHPRLARLFQSDKSYHLLGGCLYTWVEAPFEEETDRRTMGLCVLRPTGRTITTSGGQTYPADELDMKPAFQTLRRCKPPST